MKKLLTFVFLTVTLIVVAENYNTIFNANIRNHKLEAADSILKIWSNAEPNDPELYPARFNLLLNRAHDEIVVMSKEPGSKDESFTLTDSTGNKAGYIYSQSIWNDSLVSLALAEIDRGIADYPDRLDFWLGKAAAETTTERWDDAVKTLDGALDRDSVNGGKWFGSENMAQEGADSLLADAVYDRLSEIFGTESYAVIEAALPFTEKAVNYFGNDVRLINIAGGMCYGLGKEDSALSYFEEAARIAADDPIPLTNIAYLYYQQGDTTKALEVYRKIENGDYNEEYRNVAKQMISQITTPVQDMTEYYFFFQYLPEIASQVETPADFLDVEMINSTVPAYNKLRSPIADSDIKTEEFTEKDGTKVVVWTFPMPKEIPMCRYIAFVSDGKGACKIYTLEKSFEDRWVVGSSSSKGHSNFGDISYPDTPADFVKDLRKKKLL
ncbi:MAG: tetratricopeptide repeat protein [Muribaculaceae bacterium]